MPQHKKAAAGAGASRRLIEEWLPIAALSEESVRERRSMTALPPTYYLHVWWARRPLVASRAAILGALLPHDADHAKFMHALGIHGDPIESRDKIAKAKRDDERFEGEAYTYKRAFSYCPTKEEIKWINGNRKSKTVLDPTAGGGSIPFEAIRLGCNTVANDLNPVAWLVLKATVDFPARLGSVMLKRYKELSAEFVKRRSELLQALIPAEPKENCYPTNFLWSRTIVCPYCGGVVPLSPNWRLNSSGTGVKLVPETAGGHRRIRFEIVDNVKEHSPGSVSGGDGACPFPDCGRVIDGDEIKTQARMGKLGEQIFAIVFKEDRVVGYTKSGKPKTKAIRGYRAPGIQDDITEKISAALKAKIPEWEARGIIPNEEIAEGAKTREPRNYGMFHWTEMFSARQRYGHCVGVEIFQDLINELGGAGNISEVDRAALTYISFTLDKMLNYNSRMSIWMATREVTANTFNRHDFAFCWSHAEMAPTRPDENDWTIEQTGKSLKELIKLTGGTIPIESGTDAHGLFANSTESDAEPEVLETPAAPKDVPIVITCGSGDSLPHIADASVDAVVMDPPYYDNVMYAELADFFYVWLKRTAGLLYPEQFSSYLTDKDREAVANSAKFRDYSKVKGSGGAKKRASRDYQERMQAIFTEQRRVLKADGLMVLMFTHKATGAWDALAKGLVDAGFTITASWPVNTEAEGSLHIKDKNAAKSTIFLVCRPRPPVAADAEVTYWEDVEPKVVEVVRKRVAQFQEEGIGGVDLYLSCFGPALQVFSEYWPMKRGRAQQKPLPARGAQLQLLEDEEFDPYAVRPEDALMAARRAVKDWRMEQLATVKRQAHLDPVSEFFVLAWDAFKAPEFPADEALKLARVVGVNFDEQLRGKVLDLKGGDVVLWDSAQRAQKGVSGSLNGDCLLNALHHAARIAREQNVGAAQEALKLAQLDTDDRLQKALQAMLNVLPTPKMVSATSGTLAGAAADAEALEKLRRLMFAKEVPQAKQWLFEV